jgi:hypothetical protein
MLGISDFLFARPSFFEGVAHTLDLGSTLTDYNSSLSADLRSARGESGGRT